MRLPIRHQVVALTMCCALGHAASIERGPFSVEVSSGGALSLQYSGEELINYEALQVIDRSAGWESVAQYGKSGNVQETVDLDAGSAMFSEAVEGILKYTKQVTVTESRVNWSVDYEVSAGAAATDCYYFVDIPMDVLKDGLFTAATVDGIVYGGLSNGGALSATGLESITFVTPDKKLQFDLAGRNVSWFLADWTGGVHRSYRLRIERKLEGKALTASVSVGLTVSASSPETVEATRKLAAESRDKQRQALLADSGLISDSPLHIADIVMGADTVEAGSKFELTFQAGGRYENPFDPEQMDVNAEFTPPSGKTVTMPAFFCSDFARQGQKGSSSKETAWKVRFAPLEEGRYTYRLRARNRGEQVTGPEGTFRCISGTGPGYIRVSQSNPLALEFDNGTPYFPNGVNLFVGTQLSRPIPPDRLTNCKKWLTRLADAEGNFFRLRMDSWWLAIEMTADRTIGYLGPGYYHQETCWEIDRLYELAAARGLYVMHCFGNANSTVNDPKQGWRRPYNYFMKENGGSCETAAEIWSNEDACKLVRNKLRYCVARWGWSPNVMSWEFWNEAVSRPETIDAAVAWNRDMARYLRQIDPYKHPITTSLQEDSKGLCGRIWALPEMEIVQHHSYRGNDITPVISDLTRDCVERYGKPFFLGEYGIPSTYLGKSSKVDPDGLQIHNGMWATTFAGGSGAGALWCVGSHLDRCNLYYHYRAMARFSARVPWTSRQMRPFAVESPVMQSLPPELHYIDYPIRPGSKYTFDPPPSCDVRIGRDGSIEGRDNLRSMLHCKEDRKGPPTFHVDFDRPTQFVISVTLSVGDESNALVVNIDGKRVLEEPFPANKEANSKSELVVQYGNWRTPYDRDVVIDVSAGAHTIRPEAVGRDRLEVQYALRNAIAIERSQPLRVQGLRTDTAVYLWVQSRLSTWWNAYKGPEPVLFQNMATTVRGLPDGMYRIEWWDTWQVQTLMSTQGSSVDGALQLSIPPIIHDAACLIEPL